MLDIDEVEECCALVSGALIVRAFLVVHACICFSTGYHIKTHENDTLHMDEIHCSIEDGYGMAQYRAVMLHLIDKDTNMCIISLLVSSVRLCKLVS